MRIIILILHLVVTVFSISACKAQTVLKFTYDIEFFEIGRVLRSNELKEEIVYNTGTFIAKYTLENEKGKMTLREYYLKTGKEKLRGFYSEPKAITIDTSYQEDVNNPTNLVPHIIQYYKPIKDGKWLYYDASGRLVLEESYSEGKLINSKKYK